MIEKCFAGARNVSDQPGPACGCDQGSRRQFWEIDGRPSHVSIDLQLELKELIGEATQQARYSTTDTVEVAELDSPQHYTLLYSSGDDAFLFMHNQTFEQVGGLSHRVPALLSVLLGVVARLRSVRMCWVKRLYLTLS